MFILTQILLVIYAGIAPIFEDYQKVHQDLTNQKQTTKYNANVLQANSTTSIFLRIATAEQWEDYP